MDMDMGHVRVVEEQLGLDGVLRLNKDTISIHTVYHGSAITNNKCTKHQRNKQQPYLSFG